MHQKVRVVPIVFMMIWFIRWLTGVMPLCSCGVLCVLWQVESAMTIKGADNVDIGCGNAFGGDEEVVDDSVEKVLST